VRGGGGTSTRQERRAHYKRMLTYADVC
jgi:hypothetical protein